MAKNKKKKKTFTNKSATILVDNYQDYYSKLSDEKTHTLADGTKISPKEFLRRFNNEYYANDAGKEDSIHKTELGDKFDKEVVGKNIWGKDITMKQEIYQANQARQRDVLNVLGDSPFHQETLGLVSYIFEDGGEWIASAENGEMNTIHNLLKHYQFDEVLTLFRAEAIRDIEAGEDMEKTLLEYTKKIMLVSLKVKNQKNRIKNFKDPSQFQRKKKDKK